MKTVSIQLSCQLHELYGHVLRKKCRVCYIGINLSWPSMRLGLHRGGKGLILWREEIQT